MLNYGSAQKDTEIRCQIFINSMKPKVTFTHSGTTYPLNTPDRTTYVSGASPVIYDRTSSSFHSNISNPPVIRNSRLLSGSVNYIKTIPTNSVVGVVPPTPVTVNRVQPVGYTAAIAKVATPALQEVRRFEAHPIAVSQVVNFDAANRKVEPAVEIKHVQPVPLKVEKVAAAAPDTPPFAAHTEAREAQPKFQRVKREPNKYVQQAKKKKDGCCGPALWALLGLLGLAALTVGLLYAFGVIGNRNQGTAASPTVSNKDAHPAPTPAPAPAPSTSFMFPPNHPSNPTVSPTTTNTRPSTTTTVAHPTTTTPTVTHPTTTPTVSEPKVVHPSTTTATTTTTTHPTTSTTHPTSSSTVKTVNPEIVAPVPVSVHTQSGSKAVHSKRSFKDKDEVAHIKREEEQ